MDLELHTLLINLLKNTIHNFTLRIIKIISFQVSNIVTHKFEKH